MQLAVIVLVLLAVAGLVAGWIQPSPLSRRDALAVFIALVLAAAALTYLDSRDEADTQALESTECPPGTTSASAKTGPIEDVVVTPVNALRVCVSWENPNDPNIGGFLISQYPQDETGNKGPSGAPYPTPRLSSQLIDVTGFVARLRPEPGERWRICMTPMGIGIEDSGRYPSFTTRQGCSEEFVWPD